MFEQMLVFFLLEVFALQVLRELVDGTVEQLLHGVVRVDHKGLKVSVDFIALCA